MPSVKAAARPVIDYLGIVFVSLGAAGLTLALSWGGTQYAWDVGDDHRAVRRLGDLAGHLRARRAPGRRPDPAAAAVPLVGLQRLRGAGLHRRLRDARRDDLPADLPAVRQGRLGDQLRRADPAAGGRPAGDVDPVRHRSSAAPGATRSSRSPGRSSWPSGCTCCRGWTPHTPYWSMALDMLVLGIGIGLCMQVLTIIVQNTVDYRDLGVATSGRDVLPHPRQLVRRRDLRHGLRQRAAATRCPRRSWPSPASTRRRSRHPKALHAHPADADRADRRRLRPRHPRRVPGRRAGRRWWRSCCRCSSRRCRCAAPPRAGASDVGERRSACPRARTARSSCRSRSPGCSAARAARPCQAIRDGVGHDAGRRRRLVRRRRCTSGRRVGADTSLDGDQPAGAGARRRCCEPAFRIAREDGYLTGDDDQLRAHRRRASSEIDKLVRRDPGLARRAS